MIEAPSFSTEDAVGAIFCITGTSMMTNVCGAALEIVSPNASVNEQLIDAVVADGKADEKVPPVIPFRITLAVATVLLNDVLMEHVP